MEILSYLGYDFNNSELTFSDFLASDENQEQDTFSRSGKLYAKYKAADEQTPLRAGQALCSD